MRTAYPIDAIPPGIEYYDPNDSASGVSPGWVTTYVPGHGWVSAPQPGAPHSGDSTSGGGGGGGGVGGAGSGGSGTSTGAASAAGGLLGGSTGDWLKFLLGLYAAYTGNQTHFQAVPEDPSLVALRQKFLGYVNDSPTRNMLGDMLKAQMSRTSNSPYSLPPGLGGYNPYPGGAQQPQYDLNKIFPNIASSGNTSPTGA